MTKLKIKISAPSWGTILFIAILAFVYLIERRKMSSISRHGKIVTGKILEADKDAKGNVSVTYEYMVKGRMYEGISAVNSFPASRRQVLVGRIFPVKYDSIKMENSYMIVSPGDFEVNNMQMPDSLAWIKDYMY